MVRLETAGEKRDVLMNGQLPYLALMHRSLPPSRTRSWSSRWTWWMRMGLPGVFVLMLLESACIPVPSEATMLFAGFNVSNGEYSLLAATAVGVARQPRRLVDRLLGRPRRARGHPREARQEAAHQEVAPRVGGPLVRAPRRRHRLLHPDAADHPHLHLAAGRRGAHAVLALQRSSPSPAASRGCCSSPSSARRPGDNWESWKDSLHYVDYAVAAAIVIGVVWLVMRSRRAQPRPRPTPLAKQP